jgi:hypothetical protein
LVDPACIIFSIDSPACRRHRVGDLSTKARPHLGCSRLLLIRRRDLGDRGLVVSAVPQLFHRWNGYRLFVGGVTLSTR